LEIKNTSYRFELSETLKLALPIIVAQIGNVLMGATNSYMIAEIDTSSLAAGGVANSIYIVFIVLGIGILSTVAPMVATAAGANNKERVGILFRTSIEVAFLTTLVLTAGMFIVAENFHYFKQTPEITSIAKVYLEILSLSSFPYLMFIAAKQFADGLSHTKPSVYITIIGVSVNVLFNWLLIWGNLGFPAWGIVGSGIATFIARLVMAGLMFGYIHTNKNISMYLPDFSQNFKTSGYIKKIYKIGIPAGMQLFFEIGAFTACALIVGQIGTKQAAAHQIAMTFAAISTMISTGISYAGAIRVAQFLGKEQFDKIRKAGIAAMLLTCIVMSICGIFFIIFRTNLAEVFGKNDQELITIAGSVMLIAGLFQLSDGLQVTSLGILRGVHDVNIPTVITLISYWVIGLPIGYVLGITMDLGVDGVWIGLLVGLSASALMLIVRFFAITKDVNFQKLFNNSHAGS
jgi:MATE family multidrug resistance protein